MSSDRRAPKSWSDKEVQGHTEEDFLQRKVVEEGYHPKVILTQLNSLYGNNRRLKDCTKKLNDMGFRISDLNLKGPQEVMFEDIAKDEARTQLISEYEHKLESMKNRVRAVEKLHKKSIRDNNFEDEMLALAERAIEAFPAVEPGKHYEPREGHASTESVLALFSDTHLGEVVKSNETFGFNSYNWDIATRRCAFYVDTITDIVRNKLLGYNLPKLHLAVLGDMLSGNIHDELTATNDLNIFEATIAGARILASMLVELSQVFEEVDVTAVSGNHTRLSKKPSYKERYVNWDTQLYVMAMLMTKNQPNINWNIPKSFFTVTEIEGHKFLVMHGDSVQSYRGIPWYGIERELNKFTTLLGSQEIFFPYAVMGHFHNAAGIDRVVGKYFVNGSVIGGNEYSLARLKASSLPKQLIMGIHKEWGRTWGYEVQLHRADTTVAPRYSYSPDRDLVEELSKLPIG